MPLTFNDKLKQWYGIDHPQAMLSDAATRALWAERGKTDLHFFCTAILGNSRLVGPDRFHGKMCRFATERGTGGGRLSIVPRGHFKSTINTIGSTLQDLVINPDETILIVTGATRLHFKFLAAIKNHIENNKILKALYPYIKPSSREQKWDAAEIILNRSVGIVEPSITAMSWKQSPEGGHYGRIKVDDIGVKENLETRYQAEKVTEKLLDLWSNVETGDFNISGTRYAEFDPYGYIIEELGDDIKVFTIQAEMAGTEDPDYPGHGLPIFPERFPGRRLAQLRNTLKARYWAQYMNDPMPEELQVIKAAWFKSWRKLPVDDKGKPLYSVYFGGDHASGSEQGGVSESVLIAVGIDAEGNVYHLETIGEIRSTADFIKQTFNLCARWNPIAGLIEMQAAAGRMLKEQFNAEMRERNEYIPVRFESGGGVKKEKRIELALSKLYEEGRLFHLPEPDKELERQLIGLMKAKFLDRADALSYAVTIALRQGYWGVDEDEEEERDPFATNWQNRRRRVPKTGGVKVW